jgi:molecular chaperone GrpE
LTRLIPIQYSAAPQDPGSATTPAIPEAGVDSSKSGKLRLVEEQPADEPEPERVNVEELQRQLHQALRQAEQYANDLRKYRQKSEAQLARAGLDAQQELLAELGDVMSSLERAVESAEEPLDPEALRTGVAMVLRGLRAVYDRHRVHRIPTRGHPFDPELHEAVFVDPTEEKKGVVVKELSPGFRTEERVIRAAKVSVG